MKSVVRSYRRLGRALRRTLDAPDGSGATEPWNSPRPVLLLAGAFSPARALSVLERRLRRDGHGVWTLRCGVDVRGRGMEELAEQVRDAVEYLYAPGAAGPLDVIGHAEGGLVGHYYVKRLGGDTRVRTLVTLGTPHHGSPTAFALAPFHRRARQLLPMSAFLRRLHIGAFPRGVRFVSLYSKADRVSPFPCCVLEADGIGNLLNLELGGVGHQELLHRKAVYEVLRRELALGHGERLARPRLRALPGLGAR